MLFVQWQEKTKKKPNKSEWYINTIFFRIHKHTINFRKGKKIKRNMKPKLKKIKKKIL